MPGIRFVSAGWCFFTKQMLKSEMLNSLFLSLGLTRNLKSSKKNRRNLLMSLQKIYGILFVENRQNVPIRNHVNRCILHSSLLSVETWATKNMNGIVRKCVSKSMSLEDLADKHIKLIQNKFKMLVSAKNQRQDCNELNYNKLWCFVKMLAYFFCTLVSVTILRWMSVAGMHGNLAG